MKSFDYPDEAPTQNRSGVIWYILAILALVGMACVALVFLMLYTNPYLSMNPFPPPTLPERALLPTSTPTLVVVTLPPTWTPTFTVEPTSTFTPEPTETLPPTPTPITLTPTGTTTGTPPAGGYPYEVRPGFPKAITNIYHPELGCNWMGVGGQVVDLKDAPVTGLIVRLGGKLPGVSFEADTMTLTGIALTYGRAGYEFKLADEPINSRNALWVQLLNQSGVPISASVYFNTYDNCDQNLIIIDFKQVH